MRVSDAVRQCTYAWRRGFILFVRLFHATVTIAERGKRRLTDLDDEESNGTRGVVRDRIGAFEHSGLRRRACHGDSATPGERFVEDEAAARPQETASFVMSNRDDVEVEIRLKVEG